MLDISEVYVFNKGNKLDEEVIGFPLQALPDYKSKLVSPVVPHCDPRTPEPILDESDLFEVMQAVRSTMLKEWPEEYAKEHWLGDGPTDALKAAMVTDSLQLARLVHMDKITDLYHILEAYILDKAGPEAHHDQTLCVPFIEHKVRDLVDVTAVLGAALEAAFKEKYFWGIARPEEVFGFNMTLYPEGCPAHPSYPAGHGAVAGATAEFLLTRWNLSEELRDEILLSTRQFAHGRTMAGVHYAIDNEQGWELGRQVAAEHLNSAEINRLDPLRYGYEPAD